MAVSNQTLLFSILLRTGDQLRCSNWCSLFDDLVDGSLSLTCLKLIFHRHQVSYVKTMYICCWPTYLSCVRSGDTNKKYNFVINHFLTHSSSPNIDRAPYTVARLYTKRTRLVADKLYSWYFFYFLVWFVQTVMYLECWWQRISDLDELLIFAIGKSRILQELEQARIRG